MDLALKEMEIKENNITSDKNILNQPFNVSLKSNWNQPMFNSFKDW